MMPITELKNVRIDIATLQPIPLDVLLFSEVSIPKLSYFLNNIGSRFALPCTKNVTASFYLSALSVCPPLIQRNFWVLGSAILYCIQGFNSFKERSEIM